MPKISNEIGIISIQLFNLHFPPFIWKRIFTWYGQNKLWSILNGPASVGRNCRLAFKLPFLFSFVKCENANWILKTTFFSSFQFSENVPRLFLSLFFFIILRAIFGGPNFHGMYPKKTSVVSVSKIQGKIYPWPALSLFFSMLPAWIYTRHALHLGMRK